MDQGEHTVPDLKDTTPIILNLLIISGRLLITIHHLNGLDLRGAADPVDIVLERTDSMPSLGDPDKKPNDGSLVKFFETHPVFSRGRTGQTASLLTG